MCYLLYCVTNVVMFVPIFTFIAKEFGATDFVNPKELEGKTTTQALVEMTDGGLDYTFECIGNVNTMVCA